MSEAIKNFIMEHPGYVAMWLILAALVFAVVLQGSKPGGGRGEKP